MWLFLLLPWFFYASTAERTFTNLRLHSAEILKLKCDSIPFRSYFDGATCYFAIMNQIPFDRADPYCKDIMIDAKLFNGRAREGILKRMFLDPETYHDISSFGQSKNALCSIEVSNSCELGDQILPGKCLIRSEQPITWPETIDFCKSKGATVILVHNDNENQALTGMLRSGESAWLLAGKGQTTDKHSREYSNIAKNKGLSAMSIYTAPNDKIVYWKWFVEGEKVQGQNCFHRDLQHAVLTNNAKEMGSSYGMWKIDGNGNRHYAICIKDAACPYCRPTVKVPETTTAQPTTTAVHCHQISADVVLVLDASGSVGEVNFNTHAKNFAKTIIDRFVIAPNRSRIGIVAYESSVYFTTGLAECANNNCLKAKMDVLKYKSGGTCTGIGIAKATQMLLSAPAIGRHTRPRVIIVVTDGFSAACDPSTVPRTSEAARKRGIELYAVAVGNIWMPRANVQNSKDPKVQQRNIQQQKYYDIQNQRAQAELMTITGNKSDHKFIAKDYASLDYAFVDRLQKEVCHSRGQRNDTDAIKSNPQPQKKCPPGGVWSEWVTVDPCATTCGAQNVARRQRLCRSDCGNQCECASEFSRVIFGVGGTENNIGPCGIAMCPFPKATCRDPYKKSLNNGTKTFFCGPGAVINPATCLDP